MLLDKYSNLSHHRDARNRHFPPVAKICGDQRWVLGVILNHCVFSFTFSHEWEICIFLNIGINYIYINSSIPPLLLLFKKKKKPKWGLVGSGKSLKWALRGETTFKSNLVNNIGSLKRLTNTEIKGFRLECNVPEPGKPSDNFVNIRMPISTL